VRITLIYGHDHAFWIFTAIAAALKILFSEKLSLRWVALSCGAGLFVAIVFTDPALKYFQLAPEDYKIATAVFLTWAGELVMRAVVVFGRNPAKLHEVIRAWKGK
jgi:hypothetical protein